MLLEELYEKDPGATHELRLGPLRWSYLVRFGDMTQVNLKTRVSRSMQRVAPARRRAQGQDAAHTSGSSDGASLLADEKAPEDEEAAALSQAIKDSLAAHQQRLREEAAQ